MRTIGSDDGSGGVVAASDSAYQLISSQRTFRVNADNTTTEVVNITAQSLKYGVQYTWTILASTFDADGAPGLVGLKTEEVNQLCSHDHVQDFRSEVDQGPSQVLYNYAVITVGTDDQAITDEARVRMDQIGLPSAFGAVDAVWKRLQDLGA